MLDGQAVKYLGQLNAFILKRNLELKMFATIPN